METLFSIGPKAPSGKDALPSGTSHCFVFLFLHEDPDVLFAVVFCVTLYLPDCKPVLGMHVRHCYKAGAYYLLSRAMTFPGSLTG